MKKLLFATLITFLASVQMGAIVKPTHLADEDRRKKISQSILDNLINEKYDDVRKDFSEALKQNLPVEKIAEVWRQVNSINGPYKKVIGVTVGTDKGYNQVRMRLQFENENMTQETTFSEDDKVLAMFLKP